MSIRKTISYIYETELVDILDIIHTDKFPIELYNEDTFIDRYDIMPRWNIPIMYMSRKIRNIELGTNCLKVYLRHG